MRTSEKDTLTRTVYQVIHISYCSQCVTVRLWYLIRDTRINIWK